MSEIIQKNKQYLVKSTHGSYKFNNRKTAENLNQVLNNYEIINNQYKKTEQTLDKVTKTIIQLQMSLTILQDDLDKIKKELNI